MKRAILSDIHGNIEALTAVLEDVATLKVDEIYCLGDIVGYGPNPCECVDIAMSFDRCVLGNHDLAVLFDPDGFSSSAEKAILWTRHQMTQTPSGEESDKVRERWNFLGELPRTICENRWMYCHGAPRDPINEYIFPEDIYNQRKIRLNFSVTRGPCFVGHTHVPGVFTEDGQFFGPEQLDGPFDLRKQRVIVNVGSVGQPRDEDPRSCYAVVTDDGVEYRRVAYPLEETAKKIYETPQLDNFLGDRLREGR